MLQPQAVCVHTTYKVYLHALLCVLNVNHSKLTGLCCGWQPLSSFLVLGMIAFGFQMLQLCDTSKYSATELSKHKQVSAGTCSMCCSELQQWHCTLQGPTTPSACPQTYRASQETALPQQAAWPRPLSSALLPPKCPSWQHSQFLLAPAD